MFLERRLGFFGLSDFSCLMMTVQCNVTDTKGFVNYLLFLFQCFLVLSKKVMYTKFKNQTRILSFQMNTQDEWQPERRSYILSCLWLPFYSILEKKTPKHIQAQSCSLRF